MDYILLKMVNHVHKKTGMKNLCLGGGVALNGVANYRILKESSFENIHIPKSFLENIKFYNNIFVENQIKNINIVLDKIKSKTFYIDKPSEYQKKIAIEWCKTYNIDINPKCIYLNTL